MATPKEVRSGLYARLKTIPGLREFEGQINPPCALVMLADEGIDYLVFEGEGGVTWNFTVRVYVSAAVNRAAQEHLDDYLAPEGAKSVRQAIQGDSTLGGAVSDLAVVSGREIFVQETETNVVYLAAEFPVTVLD